MTQHPSAAGVRIGDRERGAAVALLGEHWSQGRLDADEFDDRTNSALRARTAAELALVFHDLPAERSQAKAPPRARALAAAVGVGVLATGAATAFLAIAEPYRLQIIINNVHQLVYRLGF